MSVFTWKTKTVFFFISSIIVLFFLPSCANQENSAQKYMKSANAYIAAKEYSKAEIELRNVLQADPGNEQAYIKLSDIYRIQVKPDKEIKALVQAVTLNPENMDAQYRLGQVFLLARQTKRARETAQLILTKEPDSIRAYHMLATAQVQERNADAAIKTLNKAIEIAPDNPHLHLFLGFLQYYHKKDFQRSEAAYLKGIAIDNDLLEAYQELVAIYVQEKKFDKAEALLIDLTNLKDNRISHLSILANYYETQNKLQKAENVYITIIKESDANDYLPVYNLAVFHGRHQNFEAAIDYLKQALALSDALKIREELAKAYLALDQYEDAKRQANWILRKEPNNVTGRLVISQTLMVEGDYGQALEILEQIIAIDKDNAFAYYLRAVCLVEKKLKILPAQEIRMAAAGNISAQVWRQNLAIKSLKTAINISPDYVMARLMLADIYVQNREMGLADKQIQYILERSPDNFRAFLMLGKIKMIQKEWGIAEQVFKEITQRVPAYSLAHVKLGVIYNARKRYDQAVEAFKTALIQEPLNMDALRYLINTYMSQGQKEAALKSLKDHSSRPELRSFERGYIEFLLGKIALSANEVELAERHFNTSLDIHEETTPSYEALARIAEVKKNRAEAIKYNEDILSYDPEYIPALLNLNRIFQLENDMEQAREVLERVLAINDNHAMAANEMAYILANEGKDLQRALHLARIAESQNPNNPNVLDTLGWVYYKQKSYDLAINKLLGSIKGNPGNPITNYHLGWAYYDTGRYEKAREYMKLALKINPKFEGADQAREILGE